MEATLTRGRALVIVGAQGSGVSAAARQLAAKHGSFSEINVDKLEDRFQSWMSRDIKTVIVDGIPRRRTALVALKSMLLNDEMQVHRKGQPSQRMRCPNFIFCTSDPEPLKHLEGRRFQVISIG